jgi:hypothetical protein
VIRWREWDAVPASHSLLPWGYGLRQLTAPLGLRSQTESCGQHLSLWPFRPRHSNGRPFGQIAGSQVVLPGADVVPSGHSGQLLPPGAG